MNTLQAIEQIKDEKINVVCFFHTPGGNVRGAYICTKAGEEITLDSSFFSQYTLEEIWNVRRNVSGVNRIFDYKITEKNTNTVIYSQS